MKSNVARVIIIILDVIIVAAFIIGAYIFIRSNRIRSVVVEAVSGSVDIAGKYTSAKAYEGQRLQSGNEVTVHDESELVLFIDNDKHLYADANTHFFVESSAIKDSQYMRIVLDEGSVLSEINTPLETGDSYTVDTPNTTLAVRGTEFEVSVYTDNDMIYTRLDVERGKVATQLKSSDGSYTGEEHEFGAGESVLIRSSSDGTELMRLSEYKPYYIDEIPRDVLEQMKDSTYDAVHEFFESRTAVWRYVDRKAYGFYSYFDGYMITGDNQSIDLNSITLEDTYVCEEREYENEPSNIVYFVYSVDVTMNDEDGTVTEKAYLGAFYRDVVLKDGKLYSPGIEELEFDNYRVDVEDYRHFRDDYMLPHIRDYHFHKEYDGSENGDSDPFMPMSYEDIPQELLGQIKEFSDWLARDSREYLNIINTGSDAGFMGTLWKSSGGYHDDINSLKIERIYFGKAIEGESNILYLLYSENLILDKVDGEAAKLYMGIKYEGFTVEGNEMIGPGITNPVVDNAGDYCDVYYDGEAGYLERFIDPLRDRYELTEYSFD